MMTVGLQIEHQSMYYRSRVSGIATTAPDPRRTGNLKRQGIRRVHDQVPPKKSDQVLSARIRVSRLIQCFEHIHCAILARPSARVQCGSRHDFLQKFVLEQTSLANDR